VHDRQVLPACGQWRAWLDRGKGNTRLFVLGKEGWRQQKERDAYGDPDWPGCSFPRSMYRGKMHGWSHSSFG
jgi:hypothetical protein